jgi:DNA-binding transcriptional ArsR family regulator
VSEKRATVDLLKAFKNPTKLDILMMLSENESMTVTQMSKLLSTSKANLYHFVSEMVKEGLVLKPEVKVKGNYVEKYYRLNAEVFKGVDPEEQRKRIKPSSPEEYRELLQSYYLSLSAYFRMSAERISKADETTMGRVSDMVKGEKTLIVYSTLSDEGYEYALSELRRIVKTIIERWGIKKDAPGEKNRLILYAFPDLKERGAGGN